MRLGSPLEQDEPRFVEVDIDEVELEWKRKNVKGKKEYIRKFGKWMGER